MKRYIIASACVLAVCMGVLYAYLFHGFYPFDVFASAEVEYVPAKQEGDKIYLNKDGKFEEFEIKGVDLGSGVPGHFASDYAIDKETYLRWFKQIQAMGANTIRVYTLLGTSFYEAFYEYNQGRENPLYLIHGVWIDDYSQNSHMDAFDQDYIGAFRNEALTVVDVVHGRRFVNLGRGTGTGFYTKDISQWVIGYILGVEWEDTTVVYTDEMDADKAGYEGEYLCTSSDASPFESMLAEVGDDVLRHETLRYGEQRLISFANWPATDPFWYPDDVIDLFSKIARVDVEHIVPTDKVQSGQFASYHIYPYYPDYLKYVPELAQTQDSSGQVNTYYAYLKTLADHHSMPVIVTEFGTPASRGKAQEDSNTGRNQGNMDETEQGLAIVRCWQDIKDAGCSGGIIFSWQDEWFKHTWSTMANVDLLKAPYWSDAQTSEQFFGLLSFDPGTERSVSYVDGDDEEWKASDVVSNKDGLELSMKYDEKYVYLKIAGENVNEQTPLYVPIDTTPKSGSTTCEDPSLSFSDAADFLLTINGRENSRVLVQGRYEVYRPMASGLATGKDAFSNPPAKDSSRFLPIKLQLRYKFSEDTLITDAPDYETGKLACGDANPDHEDYYSLADFCFGDGFVEVRLPWQLLNFSNPSEMQIHDDYYEHYGVENMKIDSMRIGAGLGNSTIDMSEVPLEGWGTKVTYHERLKKSYYLVQEMWANGRSAQAILDEAGK